MERYREAFGGIRARNEKIWGLWLNRMRMTIESSECLSDVRESLKRPNTTSFI